MGVNTSSTVGFEFPTPAAINQMLASGVINHLTGFENSRIDGTGWCFKFILCNGDRTTQSDKHVEQYYDHMMPEGSH